MRRTNNAPGDLGPTGRHRGALGHNTYLIPELFAFPPSGKSYNCVAAVRERPSGHQRQHSYSIQPPYLCPAPFVAPLQRLYSNALQYYYTTVTWIRAIAVILVFILAAAVNGFCSPLSNTNQATDVTAPSSCLYTPSPPPWMDGTCR
jgi:hypothetical protein